MILLTGASGFLGTYIRALCEARQIKLLCVYHSKKPNQKDSHHWIKGDLRSEMPDLTQWTITTIVHCAARISGRSEQIIETNVYGTQQLVRFGERCGVERFILMSSDDIAFSKSSYAQSKRDAEDIVRGSNLNWDIVRCPTIFGQEDSKNFSQISRIVRNCPVIPVPFKGEFVWEPIFVGDVARHVLDTALRSAFVPNRISVPVGPEKLSFREIIDQLVRYHGRKRLVIPIPDAFSVALIALHALLMRLASKADLRDTFKSKLSEQQDVSRFEYDTKFSEIFPSRQ